jgi:hypothetical protein
MANRLVVGLYPSSGIALDALHRLHTEGFSLQRIARRVLKETAPVTLPVAAELQALRIDPMVLGNARETFARFIRDGETAVFVEVADDDEARAAADILSLFTPLAVDTLAGDAPPPAHA